MSTKNILAAFLAGAAAGAALGILFAPGEGTGTRKKIKDQAGKLGSMLKEKTDMLRETVDELASHAEDISDTISSKTNTAKTKSYN